MKQNQFIITRIEEADFGCEGRPDGYVPTVTVSLENAEKEVTTIIMNDALMYERNLDVGSVVAVGQDGTLIAGEEQ